MSEAVYGVWLKDKLMAVGTREQLGARMNVTDRQWYKGKRVRLLTPEDDPRRPNKWRDLASAALRDEGLDYDEIAELTHVPVEMAQSAVSRVRCGRWG